MTLAELMISRFRGRADYIAAGTRGGTFEPEQGAISAQRLERSHLAGEQCLGFYVLDEQSRAWCTCVDFDNKASDPNPEWRAKAEQVYFGLTECGLSPLVEISQSGDGCHVWLFFAEATPAWIPRAWWRAMERKLGVKFKEVFPKQETLTGKGIGNLVRYPLWNKSEFVSPEWEWRAVDPVEALTEARPTNGTDLNLLAFQLGMGELAPEQKSSVTPVIVDSGTMLLPLRVQKLVSREWTLIGRRWKGDTGGMKDPSRSAVAMSIAVELVRLYVPTPEIAAALRYWCTRNGAADKAERDDWISLTVTKAYDFIVNRTEEKSAKSPLTFETAVQKYLDTLERGQAAHLGSGLRVLDESIDGVAPGEVVVIAARPGHGKSALGFQWLDSAARAGVPGLLLSEEMAAEQVGKRRLASISKLDSEHWGRETVAQLRDESKRYHEKTAPVHMVENCGTIDRAEEIIDQFAAVHGVGIVAVDYLQLLGSRGEGRYEVVTEVSRRIKQCTARNGLRTLLLCQLNREVEKRNDHEPKLSDLRESGQIEQDADLILFLQWPSKFDANMPRNLYRIYGAKRRNGPIRRPLIETTFDANRQIIGGEDGGPGYIDTPFD
jgi:KaiC/GvpD/RAD55 family RecA-like ATPase